MNVVGYRTILGPEKYPIKPQFQFVMSLFISGDVAFVGSGNVGVNIYKYVDEFLASLKYILAPIDNVFTLISGNDWIAAKLILIILYGSIKS